ncbi:type II secretion system protein J [Oceanobacillus longus]|uniref:Type II secretion system protein J n=1 Tax=Oceanobacillus longus TaxID=930120 RepID=A0ABV8GRN5_9BACI
MKFRQFTNDKGMTLVELLAALSLFAVVIALSSTVIIQMVSGENTTSNDISLKRETNTVINELRKKHQEPEDTNPLCITEDKIRYSFSEINNGTINANGCLEYTEEPLSFVLTSTKNSGESFEVKTTLENKTAINLNITKKDVNPEEFPPGDVTSSCDFYENVKFEQNVRLKNKDKEPCFNDYNFYENVAFLDGFTIHNKVYITAHKDFYLKGDIKFSGSKGTLCINGNASFENRPDNLTIVNECPLPNNDNSQHIYIVEKD